MQNTHNEQMF